MEVLNRDQELSAILKGRSVMDLTGPEEVSLINTLLEIMEEKPLSAFTKVEFQALIEELASILAANLFRGDLSKDWTRQTLKWIDKHPKKEEGWSLVAILGTHLHDVSLWENLTDREKLTVSRAIMGYLTRNRN
jgi:hypothetical protein